MNVKINKSIPYLFALITILISLFPFWIFGEMSAIGWYDEFNAIVPETFVNSSKEIGTTFLHNYAGGIGTNLQYAISGISLYQILFDIFPVWIANLLFKFLSLFTLFSGLYVLLTNLFKINKYFLFSISILTIYTVYLPYGWSMGGNGWDLSVLVWIMVALFTRYKSFKINILIGLIAVSLAPIVSSPIFLTPMTFFILIFMISNFSDFLKDKNRIILMFSLVFIYILLFILNWKGLYYTLIDSKDFSSRILKTLSISPIEGDVWDKFLYYFNSELKNFMSYHKRWGVSALYLFYILIISLGAITFRLKSIIILIILGIVFPVLFTAFVKSFEIPLLENFRWDIIWFILPILCAITISKLASENLKFNSQNYKYLKIVLLTIVSILLLVQTFVNIDRLTNYTMKSLDNMSGLAVMKQYGKLNNLTNKEDRFITDYYSGLQWAIPLYYNLSTFDGTNGSYSYRRVYFLAYGVMEPPVKNIHKNNHFFKFYSNKGNYNLKLLEMMNIRHVLSTRSTLYPNLKKEMAISGLKLNDIDMNANLKFFLFELYGNIKLLNQLYIYRLDGTWDRVFVAKKINFSEYSLKDKKFYDALKLLNSRELLVAHEDALNLTYKKSDGLQIGSYNLKKNGVSIDINSGSGYLTFNQVYIPYWKAYCDKSIDLNIIPTNGLMMSVYVPKGCKNVKFNYSFSK